MYSVMICFFAGISTEIVTSEVAEVWQNLSNSLI